MIFVVSCSHSQHGVRGHNGVDDAEVAVAHQTILHDREHPSYVVLPMVPAAR
jgi:hypothetical protein